MVFFDAVLFSSKSICGFVSDNKDNMNRYILISFCLILMLFLSCNIGGLEKGIGTEGKETKVVSINHNTPKDTLISLLRPEFEIENLKIVGDTLKFVTPVKQLFYPFGKFNNLKAFLNANSRLNFETKTYPEDIYRVAFENSYCKFYRNEETGLLDIVYAHVSNSGIKLSNGVEVGGNSGNFYDLFFKRRVTLENIRIVKIESLVLGVIHYYHIKNGKIVKIIIDSDYQIDKS